MNREIFGIVVVAVCCLMAIASAATTLDAAVDTEPDDAIDVDTASLPLGSETGQELWEDIQGQTDESDAEDTGSDGETESDQEASMQTDRSTEGDTDAIGSDRSDSMTGYGGVGSSDSLWDLLRTLLEALLKLVPFVVLLAGLTVVLVYRRAFAKMIVALFEDGDDDRDQSHDERTQIPVPSNEVEHAWAEMIRSFEVDDETKTPGECANDTVSAGAHPDAVSRLTSNFEAVRYGNEPVTDARIRRARRDLERIDNPGETA